MNEKIEMINKYLDQENEYFKDRVERDIESNRKGLFKVSFVDKQHKPITNAKVELKQISHDFNFGCNIFMLNEYETNEKNELYKEKFKKLFNMAAVPLYWEGTEPQQGKLRYDKNSESFYRRPPADMVVEYCLENNIRMKGHPLFWHEFIPNWLPKDKNRLKPLLIKRLQEISERYSDKIEMFDVVNEPSRVFDVNQRENSKHNHLVLEDDYCDWIFNIADNLFKTNQLFLNDTVGASFFEYRGKFSGYYLNIKDMLNRGIRIDAIGMQCHLWNDKGCENVFNPKRLYDVLDTYGSFELPIHISEISIASKIDDIVDENLQAKAAEMLYKVCFSHKNVDGIVWWNLPDDGVCTTKRTGENLPSTGLLDEKYAEKKAYKVLDRLINEEWRTNVILDIDSNSYVTLRAFYGEYEVTVNGRKVGNIHLNKSGLENILVEAEIN